MPRSSFMRSGGGFAIAAILISFLTLVLWSPSSGQQVAEDGTKSAGIPSQSTLMLQSQAEADQKSAGCISCHAGIEPMHDSPAVRLG